MCNSEALCKRFISVVILIAFAYVPLLSQNIHSIEQGTIRLKVSDALAKHLESATMLRTSSGEIVTGVAALDRFNQMFSVQALKRVFPPAGKNEMRHRKYGLHRWYEMKMKVPGTELSAVSSYKSLLQIEHAEAVYKKARIGAGKYKVVPLSRSETLPAAATSNDPMLSAQWHYHNTGQTGGSPGADIKLLEAWEQETGNPQVIVAVTDGGIQVDHPDLAANMWVNPQEIAANGIDDDNNGYVDDIHGYSFVEDSGTIMPDYHGTHVAGTVAAVTNNGIGVAGVAGGSGNGGVKLMSCAVFTDEFSDGLPEAYVYAADHGALISQNSWGYMQPHVFEQAVLDAIDYFIAEAGKDNHGNQTGLMKGGIVIFSAGNSYEEGNYYPGYYEPTFAVASTTHNDTRAVYSTYGSWVDISAPGGETDVVQEYGVLSTLANGDYGYLQGTSMACPHVSGAAALVISKYGKPGFSPQALRDRLRYTADNIDDKNVAYQGRLGIGRLNAARALQDGDNNAPGAITDLAVTQSVIGKVTLGWTVPVDVGSFVASYDVRYSTAPINASNFDQAIVGGTPSATASAGKQERFTLTQMPGGTALYFAVKAIDFHGNVSVVSNVVYHTTAEAPDIVISNQSMTKQLLTAQTAVETFYISNTGKGSLTFTLPNAVVKKDFASCAPQNGSVAPGKQIAIAVTFNANGLVGGTYQKDLIIQSNDPLNPEIVVPLILEITDNGAPIVTVMPEALQFKSVQIDSVSIRQIAVHNAGSAPLEISAITFDHHSFSSSFAGPVTVLPFKEFLLPVQFKPSVAGAVTGMTQIHTDDAEKPVITVSLSGEGLVQQPVTITPSSIQATLDKGTVATRMLTLTNNGSFDRHYRIEVAVKEESEVAQPEEREVRARAVGRNSGRDEFLDKVKSGEIKIDSLLIPVHGRSGKRKSTSGKQLMSLPENYRYKTNFEEFTVGPIDGQWQWFSLQGWDIADINPDSGSLHLRGSAVSPGVESYAISPSVFGPDYEEYPLKTLFTTRVNMDNAGNAIWEIVAQDVNFVATRIRINPDRTMEIMSVDRDYEVIWSPIDVEIPTGYFDIAMGLDDSGDGSSGFPVFDVYINDRKVFSGGYSLGSKIDNVAFVCTAITVGGQLDVDALVVRKGIYVPVHISASPATGIIPAGESVEVPLQVDARSLKFDSYESEIITYIDEVEAIVTPATVHVVGGGSMTIEPDKLAIDFYPPGYGELEMILGNTGGQEIDFTIEHTLPELTIIAPVSVIPVERKTWVYIEYSSETPGLYFDTLKITTNLPEHPIFVKPLQITVWQESAQFHTSATDIHLEAYQGEIATEIFQLRNTGSDSLSFRIIPGGQKFPVIHPLSGKLAASPLDVTITLDARNLPEGSGTRQFRILTNDPDHPVVILGVSYTILPKSNYGKIAREVWANVPGDKIAAIPLHLPPSTTTYLSKLEAPIKAGDRYGARIRGYIQAPQTANYTFSIASDDASELWLSSDMDPANKVKIAFLNGYVLPGKYDKHPSQKSVPIPLQANQKYYIEVLHKENKGNDHISVGWAWGANNREFPIPGIRLFPLNATEPSNNEPVVSITSPDDGQNFAEPAAIQINADAFDDDGKIVKVEFYNGAKILGTDGTAPYSWQWKNVAAGNYSVVVQATDNKGSTARDSIHIIVQNSLCPNNGSVYREVWRNISGNKISSIPVDREADDSSLLSRFETPVSDGDQYGSRVSGYLCVPVTGHYTFWIASDDNSELWLSTSNDPLNRARIAFVSGYTAPQQWQKYPSQTSSEVYLEAGHLYYIEALHKESKGSDHLAVGWRLPDGTLERPIPGNRLVPFVHQLSIADRRSATSSAQTEEEELAEVTSYAALSIYPNPIHRGVAIIQLPGIPDVESRARFEIIAVSGKVMHSEEVAAIKNNQITFMVNEPFAPGVYHVNVIQGKTRYSTRLMVH